MAGAAAAAALGGGGGGGGGAAAPTGTPFAACQPRLGTALLARLHAQNFVHMTPVQAATIPQLLTHKDVCVEACTGSGKTLAFLIPLVELIRRAKAEADGGGASRGVVGLVVSPTRELSSQTHRVFRSICDDIPCYLQTGGVTVEDFMATRSLGGSHETCVMVATPGRLWDLIQRGSLVFKNLEALVLDEADVLLDMGFQDTITSILGHLPKQRRTGLFSATQSAGVVELIRAGLRNPVTIKVRVKSSSAAPAGGAGAGRRHRPGRSQKTPLLLDNYYFVAQADAKLAHTLKFLAVLATVSANATAASSTSTSSTAAAASGGGGGAGEEDTDLDEVGADLEVHHRKVIVFFATCAAVDYFYKVLQPPPQQAQQHRQQERGKKKKKKQNKNKAEQGDNQSGLNASCDAQASTGSGVSGAAASGTSPAVGVAGTPLLQRLRRLGGKVFSLHGKMDNRKRVQTLASFRAHGPGLAVLFCTDLAARGLDIPNVDWIIQYDPPLDPDFFVHRVGRTARAGHRGRALLFLAPRERHYCEFLQVRKVPIADIAEATAAAAKTPKATTAATPSSPSSTAAAAAAAASPSSASSSSAAAAAAAAAEEEEEVAPAMTRTTPAAAATAADASAGEVRSDGDDGDAAAAGTAGNTAAVAGAKVDGAGASSGMLAVSAEEVASLNAATRARALADRDVMEKGVRAFVSFARAYREHRCRHIFRVADLDFGRLARAYGILRLPKMPELRAAAKAGGTLRGFREEPQAVVDAVPYLNKGREKQRQARLANPPAPAATRKDHHGGRKKTKKWSKRNGGAEGGGGGGGEDGGAGDGTGSGPGGDKEPKRKRKGLHQRMVEEWDSLAKEERLYKKMKRGKITKAEYKRLMAED